jgi:HD-like signal output (HDOD) protein/CheY-like chemotaxis protein
MTPLIYIVDDEPMLGEMLSQFLSKTNSDWKTASFTSPAQAIEATRQTPPDMVISDFAMPGMNGTDMLEQIRLIAPSSIRILVSGFANPKAMANKLAAAHQYLAKPYSLADIRSKIQKALNAREHFKNVELRSTVLAIRTLPAMPQIYYALLSVLENPDSSYTDVVDILTKDAAISAKIIQMANSPLFRENTGGQAVIDLLQAINLLGTERVKAAVLSHQLFESYKSIPDFFGSQSLTHHRWETANSSYEIARQMDLKEDQVRDAYVAGLMHDMGRLILMDNFATIYRVVCQRALSENRPLTPIETDAFKMSQADVIGFLASLWGMRDRIVHAITFQERPWDAPNPDATQTATAVYLAHVKANMLHPSERFIQTEPNMEFLKNADLVHFLPPPKEDKNAKNKPGTPSQPAQPARPHRPIEI